MTFRIETATRGTVRVFILSGRIETPAIAELRRLFECQTGCRETTLDLKDVGVIDREVFRRGCYEICCEVPTSSDDAAVADAFKRAYDELEK
jgi:hypothetical protein